MRGSSTGEVQAATSAARSSVTVAAWTLVGRVTGLGRIIVIGAVLGPTFLANTFVATNVMPNLVYLAIAGSVLGSVVVPAIVRVIASDGTRSAVDLLGRLAGFLLLVTGAAIVPLMLASPFIARLLTFGIADAATRSRAEDLAIVMLAMVAPQLVFYMIATLAAAAQQARGHFALAAAGPAVENVGVIATVVIVGFMYADRVEVNDAPLSLVIVLCVGSTFSVALHMVSQLFGAARVGLPIRPHFRHQSDPLTRGVTQRIRQSFVVAAAPDISYMGLLAVAATVPGGVLVLQMAFAVYSLPVALGARAVSMAVLPRLSDASHRGDRDIFADKAREAVAYVSIASLPSLVLLAVFASPIADILANGRLRVADLIQALAGCLVILAGAQLAAGLHEVVRQALFARLDIRGPRVAAVLSLGATLTGALVALIAFSGSERLIGLAGAVLVGDVVAAATVVLLLRRVLRPETLADSRRLWSTTLASTAMLPVVACGWVLLNMVDNNRIGDFLILGLTATLALCLFALTLHSTSRHAGAAT